MLECDVRVAPGGGAVVEPRFTSDGGVTVLFGASGAGKTVTLRAIAGLIRPQRGVIRMDGKTLFDAGAGVDLLPGERNVGYVPQSLALFPHLDVAANVAFGMKGPRSERSARVGALLARLGLRGFERRPVQSLSGGQQQRVALARALARDARLLLLDEPFSALDEALRADFRRELLRLPGEMGLTVVFVTHDLREAHLLANRLAVFDGGQVLQCEERESVFRRPASRRVAELTGVANIFAGTVTGFEGAAPVVQVDGLALRCAAPVAQTSWKRGDGVDVCIRAERVVIHRGEPRGAGAVNLFEAAIVEELAYGATHTLRLAPTGPGPALEVELAARPYEVMGVAGRRTWTVELPPEDLHVMARPLTAGED